MASGTVVGLDLGTYQSSAAIIRDGGIEVLQNASSKRETPSLVTFAPNGERSFGEEARAAYGQKLRYFLALLGRSWRDPRAQALIRTLPYPVREGPGGKIEVELEIGGVQRTLSPEGLVAILIQRMLATVKRAQPNRTISDIAIGIPPWYGQAERHSLLTAARIAGAPVRRLVHTTTAVAIAYMLRSRQDLKGVRKLLFVDVGHFSTTCSVIEVALGRVQVLSQVSRPDVGGWDLTEALVELLLSRVVQSHASSVSAAYGAEAAGSGAALSSCLPAKVQARFALQVEQARHILSTVPETTLQSEFLIPDTDISLAVTQKDLEVAGSSVFGLLKEIASRALSAAKLPTATLDGGRGPVLFGCEVTGGGIRSPAVRSALAEALTGIQTPTGLPVPVSRSMNDVEAVCRGCTLVAAMASPGVTISTDVNIVDTYLHGVGIGFERAATSTKQTPGLSKLFSVSTTIPARKRIRFRRAQPFDLTALNLAPAVASSSEPGTAAPEPSATYRIYGFPTTWHTSAPDPAAAAGSQAEPSGDGAPSSESEPDSPPDPSTVPREISIFFRLDENGVLWHQGATLFEEYWGK